MHIDNLCKICMPLRTRRGYTVQCVCYTFQLRPLGCVPCHLLWRGKRHAACGLKPVLCAVVRCGRRFFFTRRALARRRCRRAHHLTHACSRANQTGSIACTLAMTNVRAGQATAANIAYTRSYSNWLMCVRLFELVNRVRQEGVLCVHVERELGTGVCVG